MLESLRAGRRAFARLVVSLGSGSGHRIAEIESLAVSRQVTVERLPRDVLDTMTAGHHQGVILEASAYPYATNIDQVALARERATVLVLDGLVDPQNVGALLRTAEATGVRLVVIPKDRAAHITPAVVNASAGAVEHLHVTTETNLVRWLEHAQSAGFWVAGMTGDEIADPLFDTRMTPPIALVIGSEGRGLRRLVRDRCDILVSLPMLGKVESLNAAVAGSVGLYEIVRDRRESLID